MGANAQTSVPAFTSGQVLTAAQVTQINTGIPVFASSTERDAAFGGTGEKTLAEGQMAYLEDTNETQYYDGSSWGAVAGGKILQVVAATYSTQETTTSLSYVATSLTASITPSSASNTILVMTNVPTSVIATSVRAFGKQRIYRGATAIGADRPIGYEDAAGTNSRKLDAMNTLIVVDSPATTSSTTYTLYHRANLSGDEIRSFASNEPGQLVLMEVSA